MTLPRRNTQPGGRRTGISESAFRRLQEVIAAAGIPDGPHACPNPNTVHLGMWKAYAVGRGFGARLRWLVHLPAFRLASV
jgi:hypothetical protein